MKKVKLPPLMQSSTDLLKAQLKNIKINDDYYINTDRAYILIHNIEWFLNYKSKYNLELTSEESQFLTGCISDIRNYRDLTRKNFEKHSPSITDGILNTTFWPTIEQDSPLIAASLQTKSRALFSRMKQMYISKNPGFETDEFAYGKSMIDIQKDFSLDALGYDENGESKAALGVSKTEQIIAAATDAIFSTLSSATLAYSRDMHRPKEIGGSVWDNLWTPGNAQERKPIQFSKAHIATPLDAAVIADHPKCGHLCWGPHCQRDRIGSDYVRELPLDPDAMHVAKGTSFGNHPYGAGAYLAAYFESIGISISSLYGWATQFCVATTGQELMAANITVMPVQAGCAGITIPGQISPDTDSGTVLACFITPGSNKISSFAAEMGYHGLGDDTAYRNLVNVVSDEQQLKAVIRAFFQHEVVRPAANVVRAM